MQTSTFKTQDGLSLHVVQWLPADDPKAIIFLIHGIAEHSGRYAHVAKFFNKRGYAVIGYDHRGHGQSEGDQVYFESFDDPVADMKGLFDQIRRQFPDKKIFVYGHSMGSLISTLFMLKYQDGVAGYITTGTPLMLESASSVTLVAIGKIMGRIAPRVRFLPVNGNGVSRDPAVVEAYNNDPLIDRRSIRVGMIARLVNSATAVQKELHKIKVPILILHGDADPICPSSGSELFYARVGSEDKSLQLYPGLYHEIHNEPEQMTVLADIAVWIEERL